MELVADILELAEHTLGTTALDVREWLVSYSGLCSPWEKNLQDELHRRLVGPQSLSGSPGEEENLSPGREWKALA
jgi:hypothetical protein